MFSHFFAQVQNLSWYLCLWKQGTKMTHINFIKKNHKRPSVTRCYSTGSDFNLDGLWHINLETTKKSCEQWFEQLFPDLLRGRTISTASDRKRNIWSCLNKSQVALMIRCLRWYRTWLPQDVCTLIVNLPVNCASGKHFSIYYPGRRMVRWPPGGNLGP